MEEKIWVKLSVRTPMVRLYQSMKNRTVSDTDALYLAAHFDFSGGEIDNVIKKTAMNEVLYGQVLDLQSLVVLAEEEKLIRRNGKIKTIGFRVLPL